MAPSRSSWPSFSSGLRHLELDLLYGPRQTLQSFQLLPISLRFASLEDEIPGLYYSVPMRRLLGLLARRADGRLPTWLGTALLDLAQRSLERRHERMRRQLEREDERLVDVLAFTGRLE